MALTKVSGGVIQQDNFSIGIVTASNGTFSGNLNVAGVSTFQSDVFLGDNDNLYFGDGNDLRIFHNSSNNNSIINESGPGNLIIGGDNNVEIKNTSGTEFKAKFISNGAVELYYDNSKKFETTGYGVTVFGGLLVSGITTYTDTTDNTLGDADTGAFQIDGGLGVNKNVTVGGNLDVQGYSNFVGVVTFRGGTISIGDSITDNINVGGEFISNLVPDIDNTFNIGITTQRWRNGYFSGIVSTTNLNVSGITTTGLLNIGVGGTILTTVVTGAGVSIGINSTSPSAPLDVGGTINSSTDVTINGTSILSTAENDAVALAIALG